MYNNENVLMAVVNRSTQAIADIISHPGTGKRLIIDRIFLNCSGGANVITLTGGGSVATPNAIPFSIGNLGILDIRNDEHIPNGIWPMLTDQAFKMTLGSNTSVVGFILYRIANN